MKFKELELEKEGSWLTRSIRSKQVRRTAMAVLIGAVAGFLYYYFTEGLHLEIIPAGDILKSIGIGGFFGFFVTNSPCARGRC
ncbi:MAG: hypothetical protein LC649_08220 [Bacteroidales bacterium]|nr:hypothetical protein [Bacteroidales bacterium]